MKARKAKRAALPARLKPSKRSKLPRELTQEDKLYIFRKATRSLPTHYADMINAGMTDAQLTAALQFTIGVGGSGAPGKPWIEQNSMGLRIWGAWDIPSTKSPPLYSGATTIAMARLVYGIANPDDTQLSLFPAQQPLESKRRALSTKRSPAR